jgi:hypothetical protein
LTNHTFRHIFKVDLKIFFSFVSLSSHWPRPPPYAPWPKFDSDFHSENGCWYFAGRPRRPVPLPACDFGPGRAQNSLGLVLGLKRNPLYYNNINTCMISIHHIIIELYVLYYTRTYVRTITIKLAMCLGYCSYTSIPVKHTEQCGMCVRYIFI